MLHPMADPKLQALGRVPLFAHCSKKELEFSAREGDEVEVPAGGTLTRQGRPGATFYVRLDGQAEVKVDGERRRLRGPGDFFGQIRLVDRGLAPATVTTLTRALLPAT